MNSIRDINNKVRKIILIGLPVSILLSIGTSSWCAEGAKCASYHVVEPGETLSGIAKHNNISTSELVELNDIENRDLIRQGKKLCLSDEPLAECAEYRYVKAGETLSLIALSLGMEPPYEAALKIAKASDIKDPNRIEIGDKVCVDQEYLATVVLPVKPVVKEEVFVEEAIIEVKKESVEESPPVPVLEEKEEKKEGKDKDEDEDEEEHDMLTGISIIPFLSYSRIDAVDMSNGATGGVLSKPDYGAEFKLMQVWGNIFTSEIIAQVERKKYFTNSRRTFDQHGGQVLNLGAGVSFRLFNRMDIKARVFYGDELYFRAPDTTSLAIDRTRAIKGDMGLYIDVMRSKFGSAGLGGGAKLLAPSYVDPVSATGYDTKMGYGYFGTAYMKHVFKYVILEESFTYESLRKDTQLFEQKHSAVYLRGGLTILF